MPVSWPLRARYLWSYLSHSSFDVYSLAIFSPAPWLKVASGHVFVEGGGVLPAPNTPFPFVWNGNFGGGYLDVSDVPLAVFHDGIEPTSALTQFARSTAAYLRAFQDAYGVEVHAVGIQNELNFEHYFYSCKYPLAEHLAAALKVLRAELDRYPDLSPIRITMAFPIYSNTERGRRHWSLTLANFFSLRKFTPWTAPTISHWLLCAIPERARSS